MLNPNDITNIPTVIAIERLERSAKVLENAINRRRKSLPNTTYLELYHAWTEHSRAIHELRLIYGSEVQTAQRLEAAHQATNDQFAALMLRDKIDDQPG